MSPVHENFISRTVENLRKGLDPEAIYLFGSYARGEETPDSDVDFLVIVPHSDLPRYRRSQIAREIAADARLPKDILVLTREEWQRGLRVPVSLPSTVRREGRLLYGN
ncbi:MAG TPA: nucleotidyltransferase domain-containing protein [Chthoniobacterales bacterium]